MLVGVGPPAIACPNTGGIMARLTREMKDLIVAHKCFVATVNPDGTPNLGPKGSTRVLDDETLAFNESSGKQTWTNLLNGSKVAIAVIDPATHIGFRFVGSPEVFTSGDLYDETMTARKNKPGMRPLRAVIRVKIDRIFSLSSASPGEEVE